MLTLYLHKSVRKPSAASHGFQPMDNYAHSLGPPQEFSAYLEKNLFFLMAAFPQEAEKSSRAVDKVR